MSVPRSRRYSGFRAVTSVLFVVFGAAIIYRVFGAAGLRVEAVPGLLLGVAMVALGVHRTMLFLRSRQ